MSFLRKPLFIPLLLTLMLLITASAGIARANNPATATYEVTITNLTDGQPLTPPLLAFHRRAAGYFNVGQNADAGLQELAENGNLAPLIATLESDPLVDTIFTGDAPLVPAGTPGAATFADSGTYTVETAHNAQFFAYGSMLICTNDGFTAVDAMQLPALGETVTTYAGSFDAGTEINTENLSDMVPPCQGLIGVTGATGGVGASDPALAEHGVVSAHLGIQDVADLDSEIHGWVDPVVRITISRVEPVREYEVTIRNLTDGQPLTPALITTHGHGLGMLNLHGPAPIELQELAENGNLGPALDFLGASAAVSDIVVGSGPLVPAGTPGAASHPDYETITITATGNAYQFSYAAMLICTNDGFAAASANLPHAVGDSATYYSNGYDAGTEINTEDFADLVPPCQGLIGVMSDDPGVGMSNPALAENGVISLHPNVVGGNDLLVDVHGWDDPVVEITVVRTK